MEIGGGDPNDRFETLVPRGHPQKDAVETAILEALARGADGWRATLQLSPDQDFFVLTVTHAAEGHQTVVFIPFGDEATKSARDSITLIVERASREFSTEGRPERPPEEVPPDA